MNKTLLFSLFAVSLSAQADWNFRGTPNSWGSTALEHLSGSQYKSCQTFANDNPRFKIDRYGDWSEAYPSSDYPVSAGSYQIIFDSDSKNIEVSAVTSCSTTPEPVWCFRGTANGWSQTPLQLDVTSGLYKITQTFAGEESPARFKIAACTIDSSWGESYPAQDVNVVDNISYDISFNASSHEIEAVERFIPLKPELAVTPESRDFNTGSLNVTLGYNGNHVTDSRYLIGRGDVTQGTIFSNGDIIPVGADLAIGESVELQVYVVNALGTETKTYTYKKIEAPKIGFNVCVDGFSNPSIHHWNALPEGSAPDSVWPGSEMTFISDHLYYYSFASSSSNLIFSEQGNRQTADLTRSSDGTYHIATTNWTDGCDVPTHDARVSIAPDKATFSSEDVTITLHATGDDVTTGRYTLDGSDPTNGTIFTDGTVITVGAELAVEESMQICLWAENKDSSTKECRTLTKVMPVEASDFTWDNATVYFVITDRFKDGNAANNNAYGRPTVDATGKNIGTFHGGDIAGLTEKLNTGYFTDLGVNAIWITAPYEQIHGFVGGGPAGDFAHYGYHGYYALDYTNLDANMGTPAEFKQFVDTAHSQGIRVVMDVVMNHPGYSTLKDMYDFNYGSTTAGEYWTPGSSENWFAYHNSINYNGDEYKWLNWWGKDWIRVGLPGYDACGNDDLTKCLSYLPDFKTESTQQVGISPFLANKATFAHGYLNNYHAQGTKRVRDWITEWLVQYVKDYGIDGFRVDTAKHVTYDNWANLNDQADIALNEWRQNNPSLPGADWTDSFWSTAEVWGHGVGQSSIHTEAKFDSVINFSFQGIINDMISNTDTMISQFASYAAQVNSSTNWNVLSYISSHDTGSVFYNGDDARQKRAGTALLLLPGGVQIFYGDELGRVNGDGGSDKDQGSRSSMDWNRADNAIEQHWQKVGQFRRDNPAVGAGQQTTLSGQSSGKAFARSWTNPISGKVDNVVVVLDGVGQVSVNVKGYFADGSSVRNAYDGSIATAHNGVVSFNAGTQGLILLEAM